jgi:hypothetical protein
LRTLLLNQLNSLQLKLSVSLFHNLLNFLILEHFILLVLQDVVWLL